MEKNMVQKNYDFFKKELKNIIGKHKDEFALIVDQEIKQYFKSLEEAVEYGRTHHTNKNGEYNFSIQEVNDKDQMGVL